MSITNSVQKTEYKTILFEGYVHKVEITTEGMVITLRDSQGAETKIVKPQLFKPPKVGPNCRLALIAAEKLV